MPFFSKYRFILAVALQENAKPDLMDMAEFLIHDLRLMGILIFPLE